MDPQVSTLELFYRFGAALLLGLLVGLQREYVSLRKRGDGPGDFAGARTYALVALLGGVAAMVSTLMAQTLLLAAVVLVFGVLMVVSYRESASRGQLGITSEVAALIVFLAGALCFHDELALAAALAVTTTVMLALKLQLSHLANRITEEDVRASLTFAVLTLVILPVLPREPLAGPPFDVLVPWNVWLMVVLISGMSFLGYVLIKTVGTQRGVGLTGLLGGLASSTAVTLTFAQHSRGKAQLARPFALAILLAWTMMFLRVLVEVAVVNRALLRVVWLPLTAAALVSVLYCVYLYFAQRNADGPEDEGFRNPFDLAPALTFGALYMVILVVTNIAQLHFGDAGVYVSAIASGLADVDAITLSMAELSRGEDGLDLRVAARAVVLAAASNTLVKGGIVLVAGAPSLRRVILPGLLLSLGTAIGVVFLL